MTVSKEHYDYLIVGSGFGGSVCALRLVEKGYRVLMVEKGRRFSSEEFPKTNWDLPNWLWLPALNLRGIFQMSFFNHLTVFSGVGVGGGSLVYGCTLPTPGDEFFEASSWGDLANWKQELKPHYETALRMLGATNAPVTSEADRRLKDLAKDLGRPDDWKPARVSIYMGKPGVTVDDPYFGGEGPKRTGCIQCGGCMLGCRHDSKNSLDQNYLYLAEKKGLTILPETEVLGVWPLDDGGYEIDAQEDRGWLVPKRRRAWTATNVVFSGGVLGTVELLSRMKQERNGLTELSNCVGQFIRTNSESLTAVISPDSSHDFSKGVAISSILHTDEHSHVEPCRYPEGAGFFRLLIGPHSPGKTIAQRLANGISSLVKEPRRWAKAFTVPDHSRATTILLYMRSLEGTLSLKRGRSLLTGFKKGLKSRLETAEPPTADIPEATKVAKEMADKLGGVVGSLITETLMGTPSTAHILGGACMGKDRNNGVIDESHRVFGYDGLYVVDGSAVSANPGVNPSLTITALAERAMEKIPSKVL